MPSPILPTTKEPQQADGQDYRTLCHIRVKTVTQKSSVRHHPTVVQGQPSPSPKSAEQPPGLDRLWANCRARPFVPYKHVRPNRVVLVFSKRPGMGPDERFYSEGECADADSEHHVPNLGGDFRAEEEELWHDCRMKVLVTSHDVKRE
jgi:hypothetical protein